MAIGAGTRVATGLIEIRNHRSVIDIGADCRVAGQLRLRADDTHLVIGDHVRIAQGVQVLKGTRIGKDCVIGARALVRGDIPAGSLAVGAPARVLRSGITWDRRRLPCDSAGPEAGSAL